MGKNSDRESLIRTIVNTIVHEIVAEHTNKPESKSFLNYEVIEYRNQTENKAEYYNWNKEDLLFIETKSSEMIEERLKTKYSDVVYPKEEIKRRLKVLVNTLGFK